MSKRWRPMAFVLEFLTILPRTFIFLARMLPPVGEQEVCQAWEGFQCGFCGAEFKTKEKLKQHQFSNHGSTRPAGPVAGET